MTIWGRLSRGGGFKCKARLNQVVLNAIPFQKSRNSVLLCKRVDGKQDY